MPKVTYIHHSGAEHVVEVPDGWTLMQGATLNGIDGIVGECGGACGCATCHVYVDEAWAERLAPARDDENEMLDCTASERRPNSRLGCQIKLSGELDGLVARMPETQT